MATSGSTDFNLTRNEIIEEALKLLGVGARGETISAEDNADASRALNLMVKAWQAQGYHLWGIQTATLLVQKGTGEYSLGPSGDHATTSLTETTLAADAAAAATSIAVASASGIADTYYIGIELDSGSLQWTTVSGAPVGNAVTIADALTGAASSGNAVYVYQTKAGRPLRIAEARIVESGNEVPMFRLGRSGYFELANKTSEGKPTQFYYEPQLTNGKLWIWPTPNNVDMRIKFSFERTLEDFDSAADNADFPVEWLEAIKYNLAARLAPQYGLPLDMRAWLKQEAQAALDEALGFDREDASVYFQPDYR